MKMTHKLPRVPVSPLPSLRSLLLACLLPLLLSACINMGRVGPEAAPPGDEESIVVLGVRPSTFAVGIYPLYVWSWGIGHGPSFTISGPPKDGYVVGRAPAGQLNGLIYFYQVDEAGSGVAFSARYACKETLAKTFVAPKGKVIYIGDVVMREDSYGLRHTENFEAARAYMDATYPKLAGRLEPWKTEMMPAGQDCPGRGNRTLELK